MIKLNKLYSETGLFDEVNFKSGLNIILGKYSAANKEINGIGKSTLVRLIDFCLLSQSAKNKFFKVDLFPFLKDHSVSLEFWAWNKTYIIKREFNNSRKVLFGEKNRKMIEYNESELKSILGDLFFKPYNNIYYENKWFRSLIKFFIKDDLNHKERKVPYNFLHPSVSKNLLLVYNFYLIGLPNSKLYQLENLKKKVASLKNMKNEMINTIQNETGKSIQELKAEVTDLEKKVKRLEEALEKYEFIDTFKDVEERIRELSKEISEKLLEIQDVQRKLDLIRQSYNVTIEVDIEESTRFYEILSKEIGQFLRKTLSEVISFRKRVAENRKKYLADRELELKETLRKLWKEYHKLESERKELYLILDSKGKFDVIKTSYKELIKEKSSYHYITSLLNQLDEINEKIMEYEKQISELFFEIIEDLKEKEMEIQEFGSLFRSIVQKCTATSEGSYLSIEPTPRKENPLDIKVDIPKSLSYGRDKLKILLYDLTVFMDIIERRKPMPFFLIHDGVFHGIDIKTKIRTLNFIYEFLNSNPEAQYIITINEDEIEQQYDGEKLLFDVEDNTIVTYEDNPSRMIFKREF